MSTTTDNPQTATAANLDLLTINTIRTLAMDAVQKANSGHPGTPMALAPVAYTLWNDVLRYDPDDPHLAEPRPVRALLRPCLDAALSHAAPGRRASSSTTTASRPASWPCRWTRSSSSASCTAAARASRSDGHDRRRNHHRPAGPGLRQQRGHGDRRALAGRAFQQPGLRAVRLQRLCLCSDGDLMEGVSQRGRLAGRPLEALEPVLDLRRQPHHDRRPHATGLQRRRRPRDSRAGLERDPRRRRQRHWKPCCKAYKKFLQHERPADA